jgi:hypothetical protein
VSRSELPGPNPANHPQALEPYIAAMEDPARPVLRTAWQDTETFEIEGPVDAGRLIAVQMNADPGWRAVEDGREISIETDNLGFMVLHPAAADNTHIEMRYRVGAEPRIMAAIGALSWTGALAFLFLWRKRSDSTTKN